jgi:hypothetical protein
MLGLSVLTVVVLTVRGLGTVVDAVFRFTQTVEVMEAELRRLQDWGVMMEG